MKCLAFIVATTVVYQAVVASPSARQRRGYLNRSPDQSIIITPSEDPFIHPPWWQGPDEDTKPKNGPFTSSEEFEISHGDLEGEVDSSSSSEEDQEEDRPPGPPRTPGYGVPSWVRPLPTSSTTQRNPTRPTNPTQNKLEQIAQCIRSCSVTSEYNPVCGSNNITYGNPSRLECEQYCGIDVQMVRQTPCSVPSPNETVVNPSSEAVKACVRNCPVTTEYNPVCGTNNVTYTNHGRLLCEQYCGITVELSKLSPCSSPEQPTPRPLTSEEQSACIRSCPVTAEYNPVCGSNNVIYPNPGRLECAQNCGVAVRLSKLASCGISEPATTTENTLTTGGFAAICLRSCPVTTEYNPVCGSNNVTYTNPGRLECAQNCGVAVSMVRRTSCDAPMTAEEDKNNTYENNRTTTELYVIPITSSTPRPYVNTNGHNAIAGNDDLKINNDSVNNNSYNGNNGEIPGRDDSTFANNDKNENNSDQNGEHKGHNNLNGGSNGNNQENDDNGDNGGQSNADGHNKDTTKNKGRPGGGGNGGNNGINSCKGAVNQKPPNIKEVMECMQTCSLTSESNPVCGTDFVTYMNPGRLLCAQFCGVDVRVKKFAPCGSTSITNIQCLTTCTNPPVTDSPVSVTPPVPSIEACMEACPASHEFRPVCGSNNVTYRNIEKLQCAIRCGIVVSLKRTTHCSAPEIDPSSTDNTILIQECINQCSAPQTYQPICGSNNVTYNNTGHFVCAKQCGLDIEIKQIHACSAVPHVSPTPITSTEKVQVTKPGHNGLNFTIDPDVLANIWGPTTPKDDEDFELDQRVQDKS